MSTATCPDGHTSTSQDFCDECGLAMGAAATGSTPTAAPAGEAAGEAVLPPPEEGPVGEGEVGRCPNCGTARRDGDAFCEVCGLDYATGSLPEAPRPPAVPAPAVAAPPPVEEVEEEAPSTPDPTPTAPPPTAGRSTWRVEVTVDPEWFASQEAEDGGLELPSGRAPIVVPLDGALVAVGRRSESEGWYPGVDLGHVHDDPGVSRRHAEFVHRDDGWAYVDTGSTNGSVVDGEPAGEDVEVPLADGARVHLGAWTLLVVRGPASAGTAP